MKRDPLTPGDLDARSIRVEILRLEREHRRAIEAIAELQGRRTFVVVDPTYIDRVRMGEDAARCALTRDRAASQVAALQAQLAAMRPAGVITAASCSLPAPDSSSRWAQSAPAGLIGGRAARANGEAPVGEGAVGCFAASLPIRGAMRFIDFPAFMPRPGVHDGFPRAGHPTTEKPWTSP